MIKENQINTHQKSICTMESYITNKYLNLIYRVARAKQKV